MVVKLLDLAGDRAYLLVELVETHLIVDGRGGVGSRGGGTAALIAATIDLPLQQVHVALESVQPIEQRADIVGVLRLGAPGQAGSEPEKGQGETQCSHRRQILLPRAARRDFRRDCQSSPR